MTRRAHHHRIVLLTTGFRIPGRRLLFTRARLYPDRIELTGWRPGESYEAVILLDRVQSIEWRAGTDGSNVVFYQDGEAPLALRLPSQQLWRDMLEERLHWSPRDRQPAPSRFHNMPMDELVAYMSGMS